MQKDDTYETHYGEIANMRGEVKHLQNVIAKKDPTLMHKANVKLNSWWLELKGWSNNQ
jgi:hypothetical protein